MPARAAGESGSHLPDDGRLRLERGNLGAVHQHAGGDDDREDEVHQRSHDENLEPLPLGLRQEFVVAARARIVGVLAGHLHVAAERDRADHIFGIAARETDKTRPEPERELQHPHADTARHDEMAQLVDENEDTENEQKCQQCGQKGNLRPSILTPGPRSGNSGGPSDRSRALPRAWPRARPSARPWSAR